MIGHTKCSQISLESLQSLMACKVSSFSLLHRSQDGIMVIIPLHFAWFVSVLSCANNREKSSPNVEH